MSALKRWPDLQAWSRRVTGDAGDAQALLKELAANGWLPSEQQDVALRAAQTPVDQLSDSVRSYVWNAEAARLDSEISAYAAEFFQLPVEERQRRWHELSRQCAFAPHQMSRLNALSFGLLVELTAAPDANDPVAQLEKGLAELFVLPSSARVRRGRELAAEWRASGMSEADLIETVRRESSLAALVPEALRAAEAATASGNLTPRQNPAELPPPGTAFQFDVSAPTTKQSDSYGQAPSTERAKMPPRVGIGVVIALIFLVRLVVLMNDSNRPPPTYVSPPRSYVSPLPSMSPEEEDRRIKVLGQKRMQELLKEQGIQLRDIDGLPPLRSDRSAIPPPRPLGDSPGKR